MNFTEIHISFFKINTINPSPQISIICLFADMQSLFIFFSDRHTVSSFRYTNYNLFPEMFF
jgi:hypothetical protein